MNRADVALSASFEYKRESGKKNVTIAVVEKLAHALNVSVDELLK